VSATCMAIRQYGAIAILCKASRTTVPPIPTIQYQPFSSHGPSDIFTLHSWSIDSHTSWPSHRLLGKYTDITKESNVVQFHFCVCSELNILFSSVAVKNHVHNKFRTFSLPKPTYSHGHKQLIKAAVTKINGVQMNVPAKRQICSAPICCAARWYQPSPMPEG
jgi:hypothetical protein